MKTIEKLIRELRIDTDSIVAGAYTCHIIRDFLGDTHNNLYADMFNDSYNNARDPWLHTLLDIRDTKESDFSLYNIRETMLCLYCEFMELK